MADIPEDAIREAERLARLARDAVDPDETELYREHRDATVGEYGYTARVRDEDETLVLYPEEWVEDGTVRFDRIEDTSRAVEVQLAGTGAEDRWSAVEAHNAALVERVAEEAGPVHAANARAFADFMGNHYVREVQTASADEIREFLSEYYVRNAWPSDEEKVVVRESLEKLYEAADARYPLTDARR